MARSEPSFTIGLEEEYLLVNRQTRDVVAELPDSLVQSLENRLGGRVSREFLECQIEVGTGIAKTPGEARSELAELRRSVAEEAAAYGIAPIAASTHPFAVWDLQKHTDKERYNVLARDMQAVARRMMICALHVHVGIEDDDLRIDLLNQVAYFLPHLLVLTCSSPFWRGELTGLKSYRLSVFDELPRTGLPEHFESWGEYQRHLDILTATGLIEDGTKIWWDVRPSAKFPTLEMRIADICTRLDDGICVAAIYLCLLRMLYRLKRHNQRWRRYANLLVNENRWRAQRYGFKAGLVDFGRGEIVPYADLLEEILDMIQEDAEAARCLEEVARARQILAEGTSADRQIKIYTEAMEAGGERREALNRVVDSLIDETLAGL